MSDHLVEQTCYPGVVFNCCYKWQLRLPVIYILQILLSDDQGSCVYICFLLGLLMFICSDISMAYAASSQVFPINIRPSHTNTNTNTNINTNTNTGCCVFVFHISLAAASSSQVFPINIGLSHLSQQIFFCGNFCSNFNKKVGHLQTMSIFRSESG